MPGVVPIIILDVYSVHMMGTIVNQIQLHGIEVVHILPSCKYLSQGVDVGLNKTITTRMGGKWEDWMVGRLVLLISLQRSSHGNWQQNGYQNLHDCSAADW